QSGRAGGTSHYVLLKSCFGPAGLIRFHVPAIKRHSQEESMSFTRISALVFLVSVLSLTMCLHADAQTRTSTAIQQDNQEQTLKELLIEVRALRIALQAATFTNTQFQMLIERARVEQSRLDSLHRDLDAVKSQMSEMESVKPQLEQQIKDASD